MNACILQTPRPVDERPLKYVDLPIAAVKSGELSIKVVACGVCRTDLHIVEGELPQRLLPVIPGHQVIGRVNEIGDSAAGFSKGQRVGVAWLHSTCGRCRFCLSGRENLCDAADFTGWTRNGGFAEYVIAPADF